MNTLLRAACLLAMSGAAHAATISYDEAAHGDLDTITHAQPIFELDRGVNYFAGDVTFVAALGQPVDEWALDSDDFYFRVPDGASITGISLAWTTELEGATTLFSGGATFAADIEGSEGPAVDFRRAEYSFLADSAGVEPFLGSLGPSDADLFRLFLFSSTGATAPDGALAGGVVRYHWTITIGDRTQHVPVTEPALGLLLAGGLLTLAGRRR